MARTSIMSCACLAVTCTPYTEPARSRTQRAGSAACSVSGTPSGLRSPTSCSKRSKTPRCRSWLERPMGHHGQQQADPRDGPFHRVRAADRRRHGHLAAAARLRSERLDRSAQPSRVPDGLARIRRRPRHRNAAVRADRDGGFLSAVVPRQDRGLDRCADHARLVAGARSAQSGRLGRRRTDSGSTKSWPRCRSRCGRPSSSSLASCTRSCRWRACCRRSCALSGRSFARGDLATWIQLTPYAYATLEGIHLIGVALFFGSVFLLDLRLLGVMPQLHAGAAGRFLLRIASPAFVLLAVSGLCCSSVGRSLRHEPRLLR